MKINSLLSLAIVALVAPAVAQTPFAGDDFDGGATNGGLTGPTSVVFTPDNSGNTPVASWGGSRFDLFGTLSRPEDPPFDTVDDSLDPTAPVFENDPWGIIHLDKVDSVVAIADTVNGLNPGDSVQAVWTFDISGRTGLELSIDMAMQGDFDFGDDFDFTYSIDGGVTQTAFTLRADTTNPVVTYGHTDQSGTFHDRYDNIFWNQTDWEDLLDGLAPSSIQFHPDDTDMDGFIDVEFVTGTEQIRALEETNSNGTFNEQEFEAFRDPLFVNGDALTGTQLTTEFQTVTVPLTGEGTTLTLTLDAVANGSFEYFIFDNIVLSEGAATFNEGDFNGDGKVDNGDLNLLLGNWGNSSVPPEWINGFDTVVDNGELNALLGNWGFGVAVAVPEPTAALLVVLAAAGVATRRR